MKTSRAVFFLAVMFWLSPFHRAFAHDPGLSTVTIRPRPDGVDAVLTLALRDARQIVELDDDHDEIVTPAEFAHNRPRLETAVTAQFVVAADGKSAGLERIGSRLDENKNVEIRFAFSARDFSRLEIRSQFIATLPPGHRQYFQAQNADGKTVAERLLSANRDSATIEFHPAIPSESAERTHSAVDFLVMGVKHIWTGYDHLLFLFGLMVVTRNFTASLKIITCFTLAHSLTLAVATLNLVTLPGRIVEPLIAASIVYVGLENLWRGGDPKGRWLLTFAFGLIHGFGFATVLRELGVGTNGTGIAMPLVSFNLGVELGQIAIAALALPVIWGLRARPAFVKTWVPAASTGIAALGAWWFIERVWF